MLTLTTNAGQRTWQLRVRGRYLCPLRRPVYPLVRVEESASHNDRRLAMLTRMIPTRVHAGMDYLVGLLLIVSPWLFSFADESDAAQWIAVLSGIALIGLSLVTDFEGGVV